MWNGQSAWLKRPERRNWLRLLQKGSSIKSFEAERRLYHRLSGKSQIVPELLAEGPDFLVTLDCGMTLRHMLQQADQRHSEFEQAFYDATCALAQFHAFGEAHGRPALKDICWKAGKITFIDWECAARRKPTRKAQAKDVLYFFFSACGQVEILPSEMERARELYRSQAPAGNWEAACKWVRLVKPFARLLSPLIDLFQHKKDFAAVAPFLRFMRETRDEAA